MKLIQSQWKTILAVTLGVCLLPHPSLAQQASVPIETIKQRLSFYKGNDTKREGALKQLFVEAGCNPANLSEQTVPTRKQPNLICLLPGATPNTIIIGAHFDHADEGDGVVDNWSGASLLPSSFKFSPRLLANTHLCSSDSPAKKAASWVRISTSSSSVLSSLRIYKQ